MTDITRRSSGFTVVELLIAIVVGAVLLMASYQFYSAVLADSSTAQRRARANNVAYDFLRQYQQQATNPCSTSSQTPSLPSYANLPSGTATAVISCPYTSSGITSLSLVTITITYSNPETQQVVRAVTVQP